MTDSLPFCWHSIDLGHGVKTKGVKAGGDMANELKAPCLPELRGTAVLDIGPMDGFYSFEAERRGATRVVAVDDYSWSLDLGKHFEYMKECKERGIEQKPDQETPNCVPLNCLASEDSILSTRLSVARWELGSWLHVLGTGESRHF